MAAADARESVALTADVPPFSEIEASDRESVAPGAASSSVRASAAPVTAPAPTPFPTVAVTVVERPAAPWWTSSSTAATVAVSAAFAVCPAAITMVASEPAV